MSFKVPLPVALRKSHSHVVMQPQLSDLPDFRKSDFTQLVLIGQGTYGKIYRGFRNGSQFVIKEMADPTACSADKRFAIINSLALTYCEAGWWCGDSR